MKRTQALMIAAVLFGAMLTACAGGPSPRQASASSGSADSGSAAPASAAASWWRPQAGLSWQWQLTTPVDTSVRAGVYDIDADDNAATVVAALHRAGRRVVCYVNAGSWEPYRPDAGKYPKELLGKPLDGWPDERWLDIRRLDLLTPLLAHRLDECRAKGFDGVEPDNVDGYENDTGFPLTAADQLAFDRAVARLAHQRGLAVGLKNDFDQVADLASEFDYGVDEQCAELRQCAALTAFVKAGKPAFDAEYSVSTTAFCAQTQALGISAIRKHLELDAWRQTC
ncbi:endo alpha-1,4 polygalactosaminidase [Streptacidiphilus neutrinimicus]|uniref:endo alpha-1,4 polygalactosaminidase n=1 Tax=Streptacidiphilus neutrinimicus TaxID=105420 RepID=UPI0005AB3AF4|nr:endo alpha-1,4 polygalactosaminidase [Streptacidiphilus neutrinimicus]